MAAGAAVLVLVAVLAIATPSSKPARVKNATTATAKPAGAPARPAHRRKAPVPVLMYHGVGPAPPGSLGGLFVTPHNFASHVKALKAKGFHAVTLAQVEAAWDRGAALPKKPIVFTFDDGYKDQHSNALPVLRRARWPAVIFLTIANMGTNIGITPRQVQDMIKAGWELGDHTYSHPDLRNQAPYPLRHEVRDSRKWLQRHFKQPVTNFAYPAGDYDKRAVKAVDDAGYRGAVSVAPGLASRKQPFTMDRVRITSDMTASGLLKQLRADGLR